MLPQQNIIAEIKFGIKFQYFCDIEEYQRTGYNIFRPKHD